MIPSIFSHYRILRELGRGGMGVVYCAEDTKLHRTVALKFLPDGFAASPDDLARFQQEAEAISSLNHPNIATIYDIDEVEGKRFLTLEFIPGGTLKTRVKQLESEGKQLPLMDVVDYGIQIAEGLGHAHREGIVHRDVKTDNVMLSKEGKVKLTDFGLAKLKGKGGLTRAGSTLGTAAYISPEQLREEDVDQRSDLFSLGIVLYELLTGHLPFRGEHESAISYSIAHEPPTPVESYRTQVPKPLLNVIGRLLEKERSRRYQRAEEVVADLKELHLGMSGGVKTVTRHSAVPWIAASAVVIAAAVGFYFFFRSPGGSSASNKTIAVLPFTNMSGNPDEEYFCDGMTEDILTQLGKIAELKVISRTSVMQYKGTKKTIREIGKELNAGVVLEGSVRRAGDEVRITAQLIDAATDEHLWAEAYDKELKQVFAVQSDVAQKIAQALAAKLSPGEKSRIEKAPTGNTEAYNNYIKGREYYYRYKSQDNRLAIELFRKAVDLDPGYALAWAGLGDAYGQASFRFGQPVALLDSAEIASKRAIALDPNSAEGYKALGLVYNYRGFLRRSIDADLKAVEFNPSYYPAVGNIGVTYLIQGNLDEAYLWIRKGRMLSPTAVPMLVNEGTILRSLGEFEPAERQLNRAHELQPDEPGTFLFLGYIDLIRGDLQKIRERVRQLVTLNPGNPRALENAGELSRCAGDFEQAREYYEQSVKCNASFETDPMARSRLGLVECLLKDGKSEDAQKLIAQEKRIQMKEIAGGNETFQPPYRLALISAFERDTKEGNSWMKKAVDAGWLEYYVAEHHPWHDNLRNTPEYKQMMAGVLSRLETMKKKVDALRDDAKN